MGRGGGSVRSRTEEVQVEAPWAKLESAEGFTPPRGRAFSLSLVTPQLHSVQGAFAEHLLGIAEAGVRPRRKHRSVARGWGAGRGLQNTGVHTCFGELSQASVGKSQGSCGAGAPGVPCPMSGYLRAGFKHHSPHCSWGKRGPGH